MAWDGPVLLRSALSAAALGWHVFPCVPGGKRPALRGNWQDRATTAPDQVRGWWTRAPYNIGIACGPSALVVVDLDRPHPADGDDDLDDPDDAGTLFPLAGADRLARLARKHGERYPAGTFIVDTPSGGCHLYFAAGTTPARNTVGAIGPHIDVRADGGYVIGAGSRIGEQAYAARGPLRRPAPLPPWLARLVAESPSGSAGPAPRLPPADRAQGRAYALAALRAETQRVAAARPGSRNDTLNRAAFSLGQLVAAGLLPPVPVITGLISAATRAGLSEKEAAGTVRSGMAGGARKPRTW